jgi:hypothetical protein
MGKRGPQPVDLRLLVTWEREWYTAFRLLRDGTELSYKSMQSMKWARTATTRARLKALAGMTDKGYLRERFKDLPQMPEEMERPFSNASILAWAKEEKAREISSLKSSLEPEKAEDRRDVWRELMTARDLRALYRVCDRWVKLRYFNFNPTFAFHLREHAEPFLSMKRNPRFPRGKSGKADNSRLEYLARGMAGVLAGLSPMTGIERLRNMKHDSSSPFWKEENQRCKCWRCENDLWDRHFDERSEDLKKELRGK